MKRGIFYSILAILGMVKFSVLLAEELSWTMLDGPYGGGNITCLLQDKDGTIWAGSNQYGLFKSNDLAQTWQQLPIPELFGKTITCMDAREDFLYIGTYGPTFRFDMKAFTGYWIWLSNARKIKATSSEHFYALTNIPEDRDKIYYVDPAGDTIEIGPPEGFSYVADIDVTVDDILYAMVPDRLFRSSDHGDSWEDLSPPAGFRLAGLYTALDVNEDGDIFILNGGWPGSRDDETPRMGFFYHYSPFMGWTTKQTIPATFWDVTSLQVNGDIIAASPTGYSLDHGATWNAVQFDDSAPYATYRALMYIPEGKFMASTAFNVFFSADLGSSWQTRNHDLYFEIGRAHV